MWKVQLDDNIWLAKGKTGIETTSIESGAVVTAMHPRRAGTTKKGSKLEPLS